MYYFGLGLGLNNLIFMKIRDAFMKTPSLFEGVKNHMPDLRGSKIAVAMSGGVDSSVAIYLLKEAGYEVLGITAWLISGSGRCCDNGVVDAARVCDQLGVEHHAVDLRQVFKDGIVADFHNAYAQGETPIPCISCNNDIKWGSLLAYSIDKLAATHLASGHYAKIFKGENSAWRLFKSQEESKDQTYMLWGLSQEQLSRTVFPLADLRKSEIRKIAEDAGLCVAAKPDSQDICFVSNGMTNSDYLLKVLGPKPGKIVEVETEEILGEHQGSFNYTYGQRKGLGIAYKEPLYVIKIDSKSNTVFVGTKEKLLAKKTFGKNSNFLGSSLDQEFEAMVKIRYKTQSKKAKVTILPEKRVSLEFYEPVEAITPGQAMVFYSLDGEELLGGAWIE
jgi:tRNA-uridine 2-sulfurtransferase